MDTVGILIKNGEVVSPYSRYKADVLIRDGVIKAIGENLSDSDITHLKRITLWPVPNVMWESCLQATYCIF